MADTSIDSNVFSVTRLARVSALLAAEGAAVGFTVNTVRLWDRLGAFASNNKMVPAERAHVLGWLFLPAVIWVGFSLALAVLRRWEDGRLSFLERLSFRGAWVIAIGILPLLLHPTLWKTRSLMFLIVTGTATLISWWAVRVMHKGQKRRSPPVSATSDWYSIFAYVARSLPAKLRAIAPLLVIGIALIYVIARGIWLDVLLPPASEPPVAIHSLRQAFLIQGHGGWLSILVVALTFLRPPGHAHIFFWALCIASAAFPLYFWARPHLGKPIALIVALIYLSMPMLRTVGRVEVFPIGIAAGFFFLSAAAWDRKRIGSALALTLLTVGLHEQAALWFTCYGMYLVGSRQSAGVGRWLAVGGVAYFSVIAFLLLPELGLEPYRGAFKGLWGNKPVGLFGTLVVSLTNPGYVLARWTDLQGLTFWLALLVPFAFLPIASKNWLLWMMPGVMFGIVAFGRVPSVPASAGALAHFLVLGFTASVLTLAHLRADVAKRNHGSAAVYAWIFAMVPCAFQLGGLWLPAL
jgi:hypothetical protein